MTLYGILFDCTEKLPRCHHLNSRLTGLGEVAGVEGDETARLRRNRRLQYVRVFGVVGVPPPQVVDPVTIGLLEKQANKRERLSPRPAGRLSMVE